MRRLLLALALLGTLAGCGGSAKTSGVPHGFRPETAAAVGTRDIWVLGQGDTLVRSTDGGMHFERVAFPALPTQGEVPILEFANPRDGYVFVRGGRLWVTGDGGSSWRSSGLRGLTNLAVTGGSVYAAYLDGRVERSSVSPTSWRRLTLPIRYRYLVSVSARGRDVWLLGSTRDIRAGDTTLRSTNRGKTFARSRGPCFPELGGALVPAGGNAVWAVCPSGMMAGLSLSLDDGRSFRYPLSFHDPGGLREPAMTNGAQIIPTSPHGAILDRGAQGLLYRTTDWGRHWRQLRDAPKIDELYWLGFGSSQVGYALTRTKLWRTADGGASWHVVPLE